MMQDKGMQEEKWVGMPRSTEEKIEEEATSHIFGLIEFKRRYDRLGARWRVGTTTDAKIIEGLGGRQPTAAFSGWHRGSAQRAAQEIAEFHGMEIEGTLGKV